MEKIALDCEMVGAGPGNVYGQRGRDMLARVSLVDIKGNCIYDKFVKPTETVINYRTPVSGIRKKDLKNGVNYDLVRSEVAKIIKGKILVGHSVDNDLKVLKLEHPEVNTRDTALYPPFLENRCKTPSLKQLILENLGKTIQEGEHCSIDDAKAVMLLYKAVAEKWEKTVE